MRFILRTIVVVLLLLVGIAGGGFVGSQTGTGFEPERNLKLGAALGGLLGGGTGVALARLIGRRRPAPPADPQ